MHTPPEEGPIGALGAAEVRARDGGTESPPHAHVDRVGADGDVGVAPAEPEHAEQPAAPAVVADLEHPDAVYDGTVPRPIPVSWLIGLAVIVTAGRFWFSSNRVMFHIAIDEPAQLAIARFLSGGARWNLFDHSTWRPGMGTLLAPACWFTEDTSTIMRAGLAVGAALGGVATALLALLARRLTPLSPRACIAASAVVGLAPPALSSTAYVWAEALVTLTFVAALLLTIEFYDSARAGAGAAAIIVSVVGVVAHGRLMPLIAVVAVVVIGRSLVRRQWRTAATHAVVAVGWTILGLAYTSWIFTKVWDETGNSNTTGSITRRLPRVVDNLQSAVGQVWYQVVASAGLAAIGAGVAIAAAVRRSGGAAHELVSGRNARIVLLYTLPLVAVSIIFMSGRSRADHHIYGRYNDAVVWPLLMIGIGWLVSLRSRLRAAPLALTVTAIVATAGAATYAVDRWYGEQLAESVGVRPMVAGFAPVIGTANEIPIVKLAVVGLVAFAVLLAAAVVPHGRVVLAVLGVVFVAFAGYRTHESLNTRLNSWEPATEVAEIEALVPPGEVLGVKFVPNSEEPRVKWDDQRRRIQMYQFALPERTVVRDRGLGDGVGPYVFAPVGDRELADAGAKVIWRDPKVMYGLWQEPESLPATGAK